MKPFPKSKRQQDIDSFINEESQNNPPPALQSNSSVSKPSAFTKPTFGLPATKKATEDKTESNLQQFVSPAKPPSRGTFNAVEQPY